MKFPVSTRAPDVVQFLSDMAGRTSRVKLGSMLVILPWHDPMRVAEQVSMFDNLSGGRMILGIGRGLGRAEYEGCRLNMAAPPRIFSESARVVLNGLENGHCEPEGQFVKQPRRGIRPRPFGSFKGRAFAAAVSRESMPIMAKLGV